MPKLNRLTGTRIVATPAALDAASWPKGSIVMRLAADELYVTPKVEEVSLSDEYAIIANEGNFSGVWVDSDHAMHILLHHCEWELPSERPAFAQGAVCGIPTKLYFEADRVLFAVQSNYAAEFEERMDS